MQLSPLASGSWADVTRVAVNDDALVTSLGGLKVPDQFRGFKGETEQPSAVLLVNNGLHIEIVFDRAQRDRQVTTWPGISDVVIESALTTIMDCEDLVAAVDAADKVTVYRNWLGLMKGDLRKTLPRATRSSSGG